MGELSMGRAGSSRNRLLSAMRAEVVTKDDGRYLIYFSLPGAESDDSPPDGAQAGPPAQQPWAPDREPHV